MSYIILSTDFQLNKNWNNYLWANNTIMAKYITLKIDERSKFGRILLQMIEFGVSEKQLEVIPTPNQTTLSSMANINVGKSLTKTSSHSNLMRKLNSWCMFSSESESNSKSETSSQPTSNQTSTEQHIISVKFPSNIREISVKSPNISPRTSGVILDIGLHTG